ENEAATIYPNPFNSSVTIIIHEASQVNRAEFRLYSILGTEVMSTTIAKQVTTVETGDLSPGVYFYKVICNDKIIQSGKLISK
ncbi:MAG TPA: T9SS type A sorting domain-containing protein, partial [Bacteroidia bacterium]|nr:T9SS type A sorting domain-containing protein [Bacteroidia bacterium]